MDGLKPCPFCGGVARLSTREMRFVGQNYYGSKKIKCAAQVICNKCRARGPVFTATLVDPYDRICRQGEAYIWMINEAKSGWNRRADNG